MIYRMKEDMVNAVLESLPVEITVIDDNDEVVGWNKHETRLFTRPATSMGLNFRNCHPKESLSKVEQIIQEMKDGKRDSARFWIDMPVEAGGKKHKILIEFFAVRGYGGKYLGCMECTRDIEDISNLKGEKRLLD